jgi:hypothetical protein
MVAGAAWRSVLVQCSSSSNPLSRAVSLPHPDAGTADLPHLGHAGAPRAGIRRVRQQLLMYGIPTDADLYLGMSSPSLLFFSLADGAATAHRCAGLPVAVTTATQERCSVTSR